MTNIDKAIGENIGWRHAVTWCVGITVVICMGFVGYVGDGLRDDLNKINDKLSTHGERIATNTAEISFYNDQLCAIRKGLDTHIIDK